MDDEKAAHNERQFSRIGMSELFTDELQQKLKAGHQRLEHSFQRSFYGIPATGTVYLSKGKRDNDYYISRFSLSIAHEKSGVEVSQIFNVNNRSSLQTEEQKKKWEQQWSLQRAFNFLAGRPVYDRYDKRWYLIDRDEKFHNGLYARQWFEGIDLAKILAAHNLVDRENEAKMNLIKKGLERGDLQLVQFNTLEGGMDPYKIELSVIHGSLRIYDKENNQVILRNKEHRLDNKEHRKSDVEELIDKLIEVCSKKGFVLEQSCAERLGRQPGANLQEENKHKSGETKKNFVTKFIDHIRPRRHGRKHG
ncbi:MAG: hypothetical protein ACTHMC_17685 [Pseudobacter sp.]|uniref:hypothetical protein n=1 Tax=Pseudobacter sp. TaxID=2045420 RepID=UPI003F7EE347